MSGRGQLLYMSTPQLELVRSIAAETPAVQQLVADECRASCDAALFVLGSRAETRHRLAAAIMLGGLLVQAAYLGLVRCALCGDRGCPACAAELYRVGAG